MPIKLELDRTSRQILVAPSSHASRLDRIITRLTPPLAMRFTLLIVTACFVALPTASGQLPGSVHEWIADLDSDGDAQWQDRGTQADRPWALNGQIRVAVDDSTTIEHAYQFDGVDDFASALAENRSGDHSSSFEIWFRPLSVSVGVSPLFEHGNGPRGLSFGLAGDRLLLAYNDGADLQLLSHDLDRDDNGWDSAAMIQAVAVIDDPGNSLTLYVDGLLSQQGSLSGSDDYTSNDDLGLGQNAGRGGGGQDASSEAWTTPLHGQIAVLREYRLPLDANAVRQNYIAIAVPEPTSAVTAFLGCAIWLPALRRR